MVLQRCLYDLLQQHGDLPVLVGLLSQANMRSLALGGHAAERNSEPRADSRREYLYVLHRQVV